MANQNPTGSVTAVLAATTPNTNYTLYETNLLQGFYDPDGDMLNVASLAAENGEITDFGNGQWQFVPAQDFFGAITLSYLVSDGKGGDIQGALSFNIASQQTPPTGNVTISGTAQQNQTLTASNNLTDANGLGTISYSWLNNGAVVSNQPSYTLTQNDVGKNLSVTASYTDGLGKLESVSSSAVTVLNINDFPTGSVSILGEAKVGQTLTASNSLADADGLGVISYSWVSNGAVLSNQAFYTLTQNDVGKAIGVTASYTDLQGTPESVTSSNVTVAAPINYAPTGNVTISGTAQQNQTLSATNTLADANGLGTVNYSWLSNGNVIISNQAFYTLTQNDVGKNISVTASYTDGLGKLESVSSSAVIVANVNDAPTGSVSIYGETKTGQTLTVSNYLADADGLGSMNYQWLSNGSVIYGANGTSYTLTAAEVGKTISVKASYTDGQGAFESVTSNATALVATPQTTPTGNVTISGTAKQNQTLTASNNLADANGLGAIKYQWLSNDADISGKTQATYALTQADVGKVISVKASYTDGLGKLESVSSSVVMVANVNDAPTGSVSISGNSKAGQTLTATNSLADADGLGTISYQWLKNGSPISDANQETYALTTSDLGKTISVKASYTDLFNTAESKTSDATNVVEAIAPTYKLTETKTEINEGSSVTFNLATTNLTDGNDVWFNFGGKISDADMTGGLPDSKFVVDEKGNASLSLVLVNDKLTEGSEKLTVTLNDDPEQNVSVTVNDTSVTKIVNHETTGDLKIQGAAKIGTKLSLENTLQDADGLGVFNYQWLRNGTAIGGATLETYKLINADVGKKISVNVHYTDDLAFAESLTSDETAVIKAETVFNGLTKSGTTGNNKIVGTAKNDKLLGLAGADTLRGEVGDDLLDGGLGNDLLEGGSGNDSLLGGDGNDKLVAGSGNDELDGGKGNDRLTGDKGNDTLQGGVGSDTMIGGVGDDYYFVDNKNDAIIEANSAGIDTIESTLSYTLGANVENLTLAGIAPNSGIGNKLDNQITGNVGDNSLNGGEGNDTLIGGAGEDELDGGDGTDTAIFVGAFDDYSITFNAIGNLTVTSQNSEEDILSNVEILEFDDASYALADLIALIGVME